MFDTLYFNACDDCCKCTCGQVDSCLGEFVLAGETKGVYYYDINNTCTAVAAETSTDVGEAQVRCSNHDQCGTLEGGNTRYRGCFPTDPMTDTYYTDSACTVSWTTATSCYYDDCNSYITGGTATSCYNDDCNCYGDGCPYPITGGNTGADLFGLFFWYYCYYLPIVCACSVKGLIIYLIYYYCYGKGRGKKSSKKSSSSGKKKKKKHKESSSEKKKKKKKSSS
eukprot:Mrub_06500.p2 GENE.Mrub_06500~~Mrub_06500.p2  ORF type:complete len:224 (-),score=37.17 Mrub_06500:91-762(-)